MRESMEETSGRGASAYGSAPYRMLKVPSMAYAES